VCEDRQMKNEIFGGEKEIGGNKILIEHKGTKILLDFGMSFGKNDIYYAEFLNPRKGASLADFFTMGLLPDIKGIYREDYLKHMDRPTEERSVDALFLSHAHLDHTGYIHFLRGDIPIYSSKATKLILQVLQDTGKKTFQDYLTYCDAFAWREKKTKSDKPLTRVNRKSKEHVHEREYHVMQPNEKVPIGSLEVELCPVDHSLPGASAYIIHSDEGNLVYTGDIRFHGSNKNLSKKFVEKAAAANPKWMLCEGTRIDKEEIHSENAVKQDISQSISTTKGLVFVEHPIRDLDRIYTIYKAAVENGREFVVTTKLAYLIQVMDDLCPIKLADVKIFTPRKGWGLIYKEGFEQYQIDGDYKQTGWEKQFLNLPNVIKADDIAQNPQKYVVSMNMWEIGNLIDIQPKNAIWIKSTCEPFSFDMELDEERKQNWLDRFGIKHYAAHASGHASGIEILDMISKINPEQVIAIHTKHPELFNKSKEDLLIWIENHRKINNRE